MGRFVVCRGLAVVLMLMTASGASAAVTMAPLSSFGGGDGWLAPAEGGYGYLGTGNNERGLAYGNGHLYLVSRTNVGGVSTNVRILDPTTAADLGGLNTAGISGGLFAVNVAGVGGDGAIYVSNMTTAAPANGNYKVYRWADEAAAATVVFDGAPLAGARIGDSLAVTGSGSGTRLAAGFNATPNIAGNNGYAIVDPTAGTATTVAFTGTPPNAGDFRLGITFTDSSHVLGAQASASSPQLYRYTSFSGSAGTLLGSPSLTTSAERLLAYAVVGGLPLLAVQSTGDSTVRIYDATNPALPVLLTSGNTTSGTLASNGNGTGQLAWGPEVNLGGGVYSANLYAMSTNQGIQAFTVTVPEPATVILLVGGLATLWIGRRSRG